MTGNIPFYLKATIFLLGCLALFTILYLLQDLIIPLVFSFFIAIVLHPVVTFFTRHKVNRILAIIITLLIAFLIIAGIVIFLFTQASTFGDSWPKLVDKFTDLVNQAITSISNVIGTNPDNIHNWVTKTKNELVNSSSAVIGKTLVTVGSSLVIMLLIPVYVFIILYYHPLFREFIHKLFGKDNKERVGEIISQIKVLIQFYLKGLLFEAIIIAVLNSVGLLLLGIQYAILLGVIGALLNVIPYLGGIVAVALPMMVALATKSSAWYAIYVLAVYYFIQLVDNNYIVPKIVASQVKINALFSIVIVLAGNALWGIPGMFLSIPLLAIVKLIFDNIEPLKPWGFLLGDSMPSAIKIRGLHRKSKA